MKSITPNPSDGKRGTCPVDVVGFRGRNVVVRYKCDGLPVNVELRARRLSSLPYQLMSFAPAEEWARSFPSGDSRLFSAFTAYDAMRRAADVAGPYRGPVDWHV